MGQCRCAKAGFPMLIQAWPRFLTLAVLVWVKIKNRTKVLREERNVASMFTGLIHQSTELKTLFESVIAERLEALIRVTKGFLSRSNGNRFFFFDGIFDDCECDAVRRTLYTG